MLQQQSAAGYAHVENQENQDMEEDSTDTSTIPVGETAISLSSAATSLVVSELSVETITAPVICSLSEEKCLSQENISHPTIADSSVCISVSVMDKINQDG